MMGRTHLGGARSPMRILLALTALVSFAAVPGTAVAGDPLRLGAEARRQIERLLEEKRSRPWAERKISSQLLLAMKRRRGAPVARDLPRLRSRVDVDAEGMTLVDIRGKATAALARRIEALGGRVENRLPQYGALRARVPIDAIEALAAAQEVRFIRPAERFMLHKLDTSEGDVAHGADLARSAFEVDGSGVAIGTLSDSVDELATVQSTGDLPPVVTVLPEQSGVPGTSEGTAMMEIIYDLAPGATLFFATAFGGQAQFAQNILDLRAAGCDVIVDDVAYFAEAIFEDGVIAQAVETVVADGAVYLSSAGNSGNSNDGTAGVWEGDFVPTPRPASVPYGEAHDFGGQNFDTITEDPPFVITLAWSDPQGGSANDYDLFLLNASRTVILDASTDYQTGTQDPFEIIDSEIWNDTNNTLVVIRYAGAERYLHMNTHRGELDIASDGQIAGHTAAAGAISVAAVNVATAGGGVFTGGSANPVESFSSDGPRRIFYDPPGTAVTPGDFSSTGGVLRAKPDVAAADGVSTATPGFGTFFGTSAAAPHAAATAGLLLERHPSLEPQQVRAALQMTALDIEAAGADRDSGAGIVWAPAALEMGPASFAVPLLPGAGGLAALALALLLASWRERRRLAGHSSATRPAPSTDQRARRRGSSLTSRRGKRGRP